MVEVLSTAKLLVDLVVVVVAVVVTGQRRFGRTVFGRDVGIDCISGGGCRL